MTSGTYARWRMMNRRRLLFALPAMLAIPFAQDDKPQKPMGIADNAELTQRVTVLELRDSGILAVLSMMNKDIRRIMAHLGNPGPHYPESPGAT